MGEVDPLPLLLSADEWEEIEAGIAQRVDLLNRVLADSANTPQPQCFRPLLLTALEFPNRVSRSSPRAAGPMTMRP